MEAYKKKNYHFDRGVPPPSPRWSPVRIPGKVPPPQCITNSKLFLTINVILILVKFFLFLFYFIKIV